MGAACASARLAQFDNFAQAGTAYAKVSQALLDEAGAAAIDADSETFRTIKAQNDAIRDGPKKAPDELKKELGRNSGELRKQLALLRDVGRHGRLLQSYFATLAAMADAKAPEALTAAAQGLVQSLGGLSPAIKNASLGGANVVDLIPPVTSFVVRRIQVRALERELAARSKIIERELAIQEAALMVIGNTLRADLQASLNVQETRDVVDPIGKQIELDESWVRRRREILQARVAAESADSAAGAATKLRKSFIALVENRPTGPSITEVLAEINSVLDLLEKVRHGNASQ
jgi:hypothetical protein